MKSFESRLNNAEEMMFCSIRAGKSFPKAASPCMTTEGIRICYKKVDKEVIKFPDGGNVCTENSDKNGDSFVISVHLLSKNW